MMAWRLAHGSLKTRIAAVAGLLFLLGVGAVTYFVSRILHDDMQGLLARQQLTSTAYIARDIDAKLQLRMDSLKRVALNLPEQLLARPDDLQVWLDDRRAIHTLFPTGLMVIPADGGPVLADSPRLKSRPLSFVDRDWYIGVTTTRQPYISKPLVARATGQPAMVMAVPLLDAQGRLLAIMAGVTPLTTPGFLDLIQGAHPGKGGTYQLVSLRDQAFVMTSSAREVTLALPESGKDALLDLALAGARDVLLAEGPEGFEELAAVVPVTQANWLLIARQPTVEAFVPVASTQRNALIIAVLLSVPMAALLLAVLARLLQPIGTLASQLHDMAEGKREMLPLPVHGSDEVANVAESFNRLQAKLIEQERRLAELAHHDALTGLPNRITITDRLESELLRIRRNQAGLALLFLDLDGFKPVNDEHGHQIGDRLLIGIARRLEGCVRDVDTVARLGGDEFLILLSDSEAPAEAASRVAEQVLATLSAPFHIEGLSLVIGCSIGIVVVSGAAAGELAASRLIGEADAAMYEAKAAGRGRYVLHAVNPS